jgi:hypothetical protein
MVDDPRYFYLSPPGLPITEKPNLLGRLVKHYASPTADYTPNGSPSSLVRFAAPPISTHLASVETLLERSSSTGSTAFLSALSAFGRSSSTDTQVKYTSERVEIVQLQQHDDVFDLLKRVPEVRDKLRRMLRVGGKVYFVVAIVCLKDARVEVGAHVSGATGGRVNVAPVMGALGGVSGPLVQMSNAGVEVGRASSFSEVLRGTVEGEQIIGLEYRVIRRSCWGLGNEAKMGDVLVRHEDGMWYGGRGGIPDIEYDDEDDFDDFVLTDERIEGFAEDVHV